jgi:hypothetical protein
MARLCSYFLLGYANIARQHGLRTMGRTALELIIFSQKVALKSKPKPTLIITISGFPAAMPVLREGG